MEKDTVRAKQSLLQEAKDAKEACEEKKRLHKIKILENLKAHHGPCSTSDDVLKMLQTYSTRKDLTRAMKAEIGFQKSIMEHKSPLLRVTGSPLTLANRLLEFFGGETLSELPSDPSKQRPEKRRRVEEESATSESDGDDGDGDPDPAPEQQEQDYNFAQLNFKFKETGQIVAVYYDQGLDVGRVTDIVTEDEAWVTFLNRAATGRGVDTKYIYKWPARPSNDKVKSGQVFACNFMLVPNHNLRYFTVESSLDLDDQYRSFRRYLATSTA